ncbi:hypothetical protein BGAL_0106g00030 [Botrytis galanthina]|uniref:Uncharacterized protein n=1 Tax=Botrytis galanthina TaxID=278940 RepID=A0A4S8R1C1_9HELO|nr:hypothetical protein BGAL_0106g00030 [Botrytis galanthina]
MSSHRSASFRISVHYPDSDDSGYPTFQQLLRNQDAAVDLIAQKAASLPWIGPPKGGFVINENGYSRPYTNATIFAQADAFGKATIAYEVHGDILKKYIALGGDRSKLGSPVTDELWTSDRGCRFNNFTSGAIYCNSKIGTCVVKDEIYKKWMTMGGAEGVMGYPVSDETLTPGGVTRFNMFSHGGAIYYTVTRGAFWIYGDIYKKWMATGGELGDLGYPVSDEELAPDGVCRFNKFSGGGAIFLTPERGAVKVAGEIYKRWIALGGGSGYLGSPITDEISGKYDTRYNDFSGGSIWWHSSIGTREFAGKETNYNINITEILIDELRSARVDTLYITASIATVSGGVQSIALPLGEHSVGFVYPSLTFQNCSIGDEETVTFTYLVVHNHSNRREDVLKKLEVAIHKLGTAAIEENVISLNSMRKLSIGDAIGTAIGRAPVPLSEPAVRPFEGWADSGGLGMPFLNCDGVVAAEVITLKGSDIKAHLIVGNTWKVNDKHVGTKAPDWCGSISRYNVLWNVEFS